MRLWVTFSKVFQLMTAINQQLILSTIIEGIYRISGEWLTDILLQFSPIFRSMIFAFKSKPFERLSPSEPPAK